MLLPLTPEFRDICRDIIAEHRTLDEWAETPACDYFQSPHFCGGFEDRDFCFSFFAPDSVEHWFSVTLDQAHAIARGDDVTIELSPSL